MKHQAPVSSMFQQLFEIHELHKQQKGHYSLFLKCIMFQQLHHLFLKLFALIEILTDINAGAGVILHMIIATCDHGELNSNLQQA